MIVKSGILENTKVDYIFALHVAPHLLCGSMEIKSGIMAASTDILHITIKGNIICDEVNLVGTLRTLNNEDRILAQKRISEICTYVSKAFHCSVVIEIN